MKKKRHILIHGATDYTNFGDILFGKLFYDECRCGDQVEVDFLQAPRFVGNGGIGNFLRKEIGYTRKLSLLQCLRSDALIMMSGGYLGDDKSSFKLSVKRYLRYIIPARLMQLLRKPVYVIGCGGGPLLSPWLRKSTVRMLNKAALVYVRDDETKTYFLQNGVTNNIIVTTDTAQVINEKFLPELIVNEEMRLVIENHKIIFLHAIGSATVDNEMARKIVRPLCAFLKEHPDYYVVMSYDVYNKNDPSVSSLNSYKQLPADRVISYEYYNSWQLAALINKCDLIITTKLHVGIIGATLNKSVVSFPMHREKTQRYYKQIGESGRSIHISEVTEEIVKKQLDMYFEKPIVLSDSIREQAKKNLAAIHMAIKGRSVE